jgi:hypothetical protein
LFSLFSLEEPAVRAGGRPRIPDFEAGGFGMVVADYTAGYFVMAGPFRLCLDRPPARSTSST